MPVPDTASPPIPMDDQHFRSLIAELGGDDLASQRGAISVLVSAAIEHMRTVAHRMLRRFPQVRRWEETDDVVQGAALRLTRALESVAPHDARHFLNLMAMQVRRELIDLARRYGGVESFAQHHETNAIQIDGRHVLHSDLASDPVPKDAESENLWGRFHEAAESLDEESRELFSLVWYLGLNQEQAALALGCSVRTVARRWDVLKRQLVNRMDGQSPT